MFAAIFFDLDDTLCDDTGASRRAITLACARLRAQYPSAIPAALDRAYLDASRALWTDDPVRLAGPVRAMRLQAWTAALASVGADTALALPAVTLYAEARRETYALYPEALPLLHALRATCHLGLITNGPADLQRDKVTAMGLVNNVDQMVIAGEVGVSKPDPDIFHFALRQAGCFASQAIMIGNSWEKDILAARAIGMTALWICPDAAPDTADTLPHIREVPAWLISRGDYTLRTHADG